MNLLEKNFLDNIDDEEFSIYSKDSYLKAGIQYGHQFSHPKMNEYVYKKPKVDKERKSNRIKILDMNKIISSVKNISSLITQIYKDGEEILLVGKFSNSEFKDITKEYANKSNSFYFADKWTAGFFTNFSCIRKEIGKIENLKNSLEKTSNKKIKSGIEHDIFKLMKKYEGVINLSSIPKFIFIYDLKNANIIVSEAKKIGVTIISVCDVDCDPSTVDYFMIGNDDGIKSAKFFFRVISDAIIEGKKSLESNLDLNEDK